MVIITTKFFAMRSLTKLIIFCRGAIAKLLLGVALVGSAPFAWAQVVGSPFTCDVVFYQVRNPGTAHQIFGYPTINSGLAPTAIYAADKTNLNLNALAYNPVDNYMYGLGVTATVPTLYRIGQTGYELVGTIADTNGSAIVNASGTFLVTAGAFDAGGRYYFAGQGISNGLGNSIAPNAIFRVDSVPATGNIVASHRYNINVPSVMNIGDFDFNGAGGPNGLLLGASKQADYGNIPTMHRITLQASPSTAIGTANVVTSTLAGPPTGAGGFSIGSAFWDAAANGGVGRFYVFDNSTSTFWQVTNPETGAASATALAVPPPTGPTTTANFYTTGTSDGTSCPISGTRRADLQIVKSDSLVTATVGQVTNYQITVTNAGPYPANYSIVRDPPAAGLQKLSVTCTAPGGPPSAVCPAVLTVNALETTGVQVITFPPGSQLVFSLNTLITAPISQGVVTNTASVTPAIDTIDGTLTNNISTDTTVLANSTTSVISAASVCPAPGTTESLTNLLLNGDISATTPLGTSATLVALNSAPTNVGPGANTLSRQQGPQAYPAVAGRAFSVSQNPFPGDAARSVLGSNFWLLSNGKVNPNYNIWSQTLTGLTVGKTYEFMYYASNASLPVAGNLATVAPVLQPQLNGVNLGAAITLAPETALDQWTLVQRTFTAVAPTAFLAVQNTTAATATENGDMAAITQLTVRSCEPSANVRISKTNNVTSLSSGGTSVYTITISNPSIVTATTVLFADPAVPNFIKNTVTCTPSGASLCPAPAVTVLAVEGAGASIPRIAPNSTVTFVIGGTVTGAPGTTVTNIATVAAVGFTDPDTSDNSAQDSDPVLGSVNVSIVKTNTVTSSVAGSTTSYLITLTSNGVSTLINGVLRDTPSAGLQCTSIVCESTTGAAICPGVASTTIANLTGPGIIIPSIPGTPASTMTFRVNCNVIATGQP
jgi:uncharacterized repeat protein (TIGR01451 family)